MTAGSQESELERLQQENRYLRSLLAEREAAPEFALVHQPEKPETGEALPPDQERLSRLFMQMPAFVAVLRGPNHVFELANPLYSQLVGNRDILGKPARDAFPDVEGQGFFEMLDEVYRSGRPFLGREMPVLFQNRAESSPQEHYLDFIYQPLFEADGAVSGIFVHGIDLTDRKRAEEQLRTGRQRLEATLHTARMVIWDWDPLTGKAVFSSSAQDVFGYLPGEADDSASGFQIIHPDDWERHRALVQRASGRGEGWHSEFRIIRPCDGKVVWLEERATTMPDPQTGKLRVTGLVWDITERKRAEEQERRAAEDARSTAEANAKFRTFFEQGSYFAGVMTPDGTLVEANRLCLDACGYTREEVIGRKFWDCGWWNRSPELQEMVREGTRQAVQGMFFRRESRYFLADGTERVVDLILAPVKDESDQVLFIAPTGTDITERKRAEQTLKERAKEIERLNVRLKRAMTETHHRVKNNLQILAAMLDMQRMEHSGGLPHSEGERLSMQIRTLAMVHDLLTQQSREGEEAEILSIADLLNQLLSLLQESVGPSLEFAVEDAQVTIRQGTSLALIVNELVNNAAKYGRGKIHVSFACREESALLLVADDGPGFPAGFSPRQAAHTGLELVESLARHDLNGETAYQNGEKGGGLVTIRFQTGNAVAE